MYRPENFTLNRATSNNVFCLALMPNRFSAKHLKRQDVFNRASRDQNHLYWGNKLVSAADPSTFELLVDDSKRQSPFMENFYGKDKTHVFYADKIISDADPASFDIERPQRSPWDAHDANHKYSHGKVYK
jgi:DKNYY family